MENIMLEFKDYTDFVESCKELVSFIQQLKRDIASHQILSVLESLAKNQVAIATWHKQLVQLINDKPLV
jgi:translation elongation factor EF-Ts